MRSAQANQPRGVPGGGASRAGGTRVKSRAEALPGVLFDLVGDTQRCAAQLLRSDKREACSQTPRPTEKGLPVSTVCFQTGPSSKSSASHLAANLPSTPPSRVLTPAPATPARRGGLAQVSPGRPASAAMPGAAAAFRTLPRALSPSTRRAQIVRVSPPLHFAAWAALRDRRPPVQSDRESPAGF